MTQSVIAETNMTTEERKARLEHLSGWFDDLRCAIGLSDWTIHFKTGAPSEGATAESWRRASSKEGVVRFSDEFFESSREAQREVTLHELLHFVMRPIYECHKLLEPIAAPQTFTVIDTAFENAEEWVVDSLARAIAHRFKLPPVYPIDMPEPVGVEVPLLMRFPDGDELRRTVVIGSEGLAALTDAITGIQASRLGKESWKDFTGRVRAAADRMIDPDGDGVPDYKLATGATELAVTEDATPEIVAAEEWSGQRGAKLTQESRDREGFAFSGPVREAPVPTYTEEAMPTPLEISEASGIPEMQEYRPEPIEMPAFDPAERPRGKHRPKGGA